MLAPRGRDRTHWRAGVDAEKGRFAVNLCPEQEMILPRALQGQGLKLRTLGVQNQTVEIENQRFYHFKFVVIAECRAISSATSNLIVNRRDCSAADGGSRRRPGRAAGPGFFAGYLLDQTPKGRHLVAGHVEGDYEKRDEIPGIDVILRPAGDLG